MELICLGLNHKTAPVEVRERFAVGNTKLGEASQNLLEMVGAPEGVVVSTCNRTEFYLAADSAPAAMKQLEHCLAEKVHGHEEPFYRYEKAEAARHLCKVVSGLDSMLLGETEIFGQVKQAYKAAHAAGTTGPILNKLFQKVFSVGKKSARRHPSKRAPPPSETSRSNSRRKFSAT